MYRGIPFRTFFVTIFLVAFILLVVVLSSLRGHQAAMRNLVAERDQRSVDLLSSLIGEQLRTIDDPATELAQILDRSLPDDRSTAVFVVDPLGEIIYQQGHLHDDGAFLVQHAGVAEGLSGERGILFAPAPDGEHIVAHAPLDVNGWAIIVEEPWQQVLSTQLRVTELAPLTLIPLIAVTLAALWFGQRQVVTPLRHLAQQAGQLGNGHFDAIHAPIDGISEIRQLQTQFKKMAAKVEQAQRNLRDYASAVTLGQEEERKRVARELHDGAIQTLTVINQEVKLAQWDNPQGELAEMLAHMEDEIATLMKELRHMIRDLRPSYLEELGLVAALETLIKDYRSTWKLPIRFKVEGKEQMLESTESLALYRITQEALNNVQQHAAATDVAVYLRFEPSLLRLTILDNGQGFDPPASFIANSADGHFGLLGAYERAELIGAHLAVVSAPDDGTEVTISLPRNHKSAAVSQNGMVYALP